MKPQAWFEMQDLRKRRLADAVWIPLRASKMVSSGTFGNVAFEREFFGAGSVAIPLARRWEATKLGWPEIGLGHLHRVYAAGPSYKAVDVYRGPSGADLGVELVLDQEFDGAEPSVWHLHQDLVVALGLLREGDVWVCPHEGYLEVAKLTRDSADGNAPVELVIRAEHLRDYLAARGMALRVATYRSHQSAMADASHITWPEPGIRESRDDERFETHKSEMHEGGTPCGTRTAFFHVARTDLDAELDVPLLGPETATNTAARSWSLEARGERLWSIEGELWRNEWIEPAPLSARVRGDTIPSTCHFATDALGTRVAADALRDQDIGRWLWFKPDVVNAILALRGSSLGWYTRDTGQISALHGYGVHFGINSKDLLTAYAFDVARLPEWLRQLWVGFNVPLDGKVSEELLAAQVRADPAGTRAPEMFFVGSRRAVADAFHARWNAPLFSEHESTPKVLGSIHRFRAHDRESLLAIAKDLARVTADSINLESVRGVAPTKKDEKRGSLKSLEAALATVVPCDDARRLLGPLFGVYDLRVADAHIASADLTKPLALCGIDPSASWLRQAMQLLESTADALTGIAEALQAPNAA